MDGRQQKLCRRDKSLLHGACAVIRDSWWTDFMGDHYHLGTQFVTEGAAVNL
jgi:hypothetical protein